MLAIMGGGMPSNVPPARPLLRPAGRPRLPSAEHPQVRSRGRGWYITDGGDDAGRDPIEIDVRLSTDETPYLGRSGRAGSLKAHLVRLLVGHPHDG